MTIQSDDLCEKEEMPQLIALRDGFNGVVPSLTIAIPAYHHESHIAECLREISSYRYPEQVEILLVDDCSQDETVNVAVRVLEQSNANFRIYRNVLNKGLTYSLGFLLDNARSDFFLVCASDDKIDGSALKNLLVQLDEGKGPEAFTIFSAEYFGDQTGYVYDCKRLVKETAVTKRFHRWISTHVPRPLLLQSTVFNTAFLRRSHPWRDGLILDDWPTFIRAAQLAMKEGATISFEQEITLTQYRIHGQGIHHDIERQRRACLEVSERVVSPEFRRVAQSAVYLDFALIDASKLKWRNSWQGYAKAIAINPSIRTILLFPLMLLFFSFRAVLRAVR